MDKKLFLIDAYALIFRSHFAFIRNPRRTSKGINTSAVYGFVNTLIEVLRTENPEYIAVVFDPPGPTFRNELYVDYKANREETPEDIKTAVPYIKKILDGMHIPVIEIQGFEADDVIGSLAFKAVKEGFNTFMMTPDKDFCQLVGQGISIYKPGKSGNDPEIIGIEEVKTNFNVNNPCQVVDVLALWGDSSDNVPGAPGIGEKQAKQLVGEYGSLEVIYHNISKLTNRQQKSLSENKEQIMLSRKLVTIETAIPIDISFEIMKRQKPNEDKLNPIFKELEFGNIVNRLLNTNNNDIQNTKRAKSDGKEHLVYDLFNQTPPENNPSQNYNTINDTKHNYILVNTNEQIDNLIQTISESKEFCFDTETTGLDPLLAELVGISFCIKPFEAWFVPFPQNQEEAKKLASKFTPIFKNKEINKAGQNIKFDMLILKRYGIDVKGNLFDTMIAHYLINPDAAHNLEALSKTYLNYLPVPIENLIGKKGRNQMSMRLVEIEKLKEYACEDADLVHRLKEKLEPELKEKSLYEVFSNIEMPLVPVLVHMEWNGVKLDVKELKTQSQSLKKDLELLQSDIFKLAGMQFNLNSPKQLGDILFGKLKIISDPKLTKTKQFSTSEDTLSKLTGKHEIIDKILEFRGLQKLLSTYTDALPNLVNPQTKRLHTSFNQTVTATGRLSSTNPNLQNIPIRDERGRIIRKAFIASDNNHIFLSADYSQIELRLMAHLSKDASMIEAFANKEDIHQSTAAKIFKIQPNDVDRTQRSYAKTANFGIIYGISAFGLSERLNIPRTEAKQLIDNYFETFPGVKNYMEESIKKARAIEGTVTYFGRIRPLPDINSANKTQRDMAERNAINSPIQGTAADIIKLAMINILKEFENKNLKTKILIQVHDELNFDVPTNELENVKEIIINCMENVVKLSVPLSVDFGIGKNWFEAH